MSELGDTLELRLDPPVSVKGGEVSLLIFAEPRARHVRDAEKKLDARMSEASITEYEVALITACAGVDAAVAHALTARQSGEAVNWLQRFIGNSYGSLEDDPLDDLPDGPFDFEVSPPLSWQGIDYPTLTLREPTLEELRKARAHTRQAMTPYTVRARDIELLRLVSGLPPAVIDGLRIRTQVEATRQLARFIEAGRRAGNT